MKNDSHYFFQLALIVLLFFSFMEQMYAQHRDTLFVIEEEFVYDTLFVHDTLHRHDTIILEDYIHSPEFERLFYETSHRNDQQFSDSANKNHQQTVTFWENLVFNSKQENFSNMDSVKKYGLVGLIILGLNTLAPAQQDNSIIFNQKRDIYPKHEIGLSYGFAPTIGLLYFGSFDDVVSEVFCLYRELLPGSVNLQYHLHFTKSHSLDFNFTWSAMKHSAPSIYQRHWAYENDYVHRLCFQTGYSIHFFNTEKISLYSSFYLGATLFLIGDAAYYENGINHLQEVPKEYSIKNCQALSFDFQINYLGIRIGKHNATNIELGFGSQGMLKIGYSYKF